MYHPNQNDDDCDDEQDVNKSTDSVDTYDPEKPKDEQYDSNGCEHIE